MFDNIVNWNDMKLNTAMERFEKFLKYEKGYSDNTVKSYMNTIKKFVDFSFEKRSARVTSVTQNHIVNYLENVLEDNSKKTRNQRYFAIKKFFTFLENRNQLRKDKNPCEGLSMMQIEKTIEPVYMNKKEVERYLKAIEEDISENSFRDKVIIYTFLLTGIRISEIHNLNVSDIDFESENIKFYGKGKKERIIPLHEKLINLYKQYLRYRKEELFLRTEDAKKALFVSRKGERLSKRQIRRMVKKYVDKAGIDKNITPHKLRHTFASYFYKKTKNLQALRDILGHNSITTTDIYTHVDQEEKRSEINNIDF